MKFLRSIVDHLLLIWGLLQLPHENENEPASMNHLPNTLHAAALFLWNKLVAILFLIFLMICYCRLSSEKPTPFAEVLYAAILGIVITVLGPFIRLLVFPESAEYAERGQLRKDISLGGTTPPPAPSALRHYWFATGISYLIAILCVSRLL